MNERPADAEGRAGPDAWRETPRASDVEAVRALVERSAVFSAAEVAMAASLVVTALQAADADGYHFLFADRAEFADRTRELGALDGYACYGPIEATAASFDLYWIVVEPGQQRRGLGRRLLAAVEARVAGAGGGRLYVETSTRADYAPAHAFYARAGYRQQARLDDFYAAGDGKLIYVKAPLCVGAASRCPDPSEF